MKHYVKHLTPFALLCAILVSLTLRWPQNVRAATAATLDTVYQYKMVNEKSGLGPGMNPPWTTAGSNALQWSDNGSSFGSWWHCIYIIQIDPTTGKQLSTHTTDGSEPSFMHPATDQNFKPNPVGNGSKPYTKLEGYRQEVKPLNN